MKQSSLLVLVAASLIMVGGGCSKIQERYGVDNKTVSTADTKTAATKDSVNLYDAELFLRSRDDIAPGQADVTNQTLFAKTKDGQIVEIVKDVHEALQGRLPTSYYLVQEKNIPESNRYAYYIAKELVQRESESTAYRLYAFDKESKKFVTTPVVELTESQMVGTFKYSPNNKKIAIVRQEPEQAEIVYIGDVATGNVTHKYEVSEAYTFIDPNTSGFAVFIHPETKWADNNLFQIALFKPNQKAENGKFEPVDVVVIDTVQQLKEGVLLNSDYSYDAALDTLFLEIKETGVAAAVKQEVSDEIVTTGFAGITPVVGASIYTGKSASDPYIIFSAPSGYDFVAFAGIYDKRLRKFLDKQHLPAGLETTDLMLNNAVLSKSGKRLALFNKSLMLMDLQTLQLSKHTLDEKFGLHSYLSGKLESEFSDVKHGPNFWKDDNTFVVHYYDKDVEVEKYAGKNGNFAVDLKLKKTVTFKFK